MDAAQWYTRSTEALRTRFGSDWRMVAALIAATSPRLSPQRNLALALACYSARKSAQPLPHMMPAHHHNVTRALSGKSLKGPKVRAFYRALCGDPNAVTIDVWMLRTFPRSKPHNIVRIIKRRARKHSVTPRDMQAIIWCHVRAVRGLHSPCYADLLTPPQQEAF